MYNKDMLKGGAQERSGFTIIEVMLTLAISGMIFVGALVGVGSTLSRQRYKDSLEDVASFFRHQYDYVNRVQIDKRGNDANVCPYWYSGTSYTGSIDVKGRGRSACDVYGIVIVVEKDKATTYNLVGRDYNFAQRYVEGEERIDGTEGSLSALGKLRANIAYKSGVGDFTPTKVISEKTFKWKAKLTEKDSASIDSQYVIAVFRSPVDGIIHTVSYNLSNGGEVPQESNDYYNTNNAAGAGFWDIFKNGQAQYNDVELCISSEDALASYGNVRRMLLISKDAHDASSVGLVELDDTTGGHQCSE